MTLNGTETRWHLTSTPSDVSPTPGTGWNYTSASLARYMMVPANQESASTPTFDNTQSVNDIPQGNSCVRVQFISTPLPGPQVLSTRVPSGVIGMYLTGSSPTSQFWHAAYFWRPSTGVKIASSLYFVSPETPNSDSTQLANGILTTKLLVPVAGARVGTVILQPGDRFVVEVGNAANSAGTGTVSFRTGNPGASANTYGDYPLTQGIVQAGANPWVAIDQDLYASHALPNSQQVSSSGGISVSLGR